MKDEVKVLNSAGRYFVDTMKHAVRALTGKEPEKIDIKVEVLGNGEGTVLIIDAFHIYKGDMVVKTIAGPVKRKGWIVDRAVEVYNYPHEPNDVDIDSVYETGNLHAAVCYVIKELFSSIVWNRLESDALASLFEEEDIPF